MARKTVRLADLCSLIAEPVKPGTRNDAVYLGLEHLAPGRLTPIGSGKASEMRSNTSAFQPGDVLYGKLRPYLDKAVLADCPGVCTTELLVLRAKEGVDQRFLATVVHSPTFVEYAVAGTTGVQHPRTSWAHIREFETPALSLKDQQHVADMLWLVHEAIVRSEKLTEIARSLKYAVMHTLFTHGLQGEAPKETEIGLVPTGWKVVQLKTLCKKTGTVNLPTEANRIIEYVNVSSISRAYLKIEMTTRHTLKDAPSRARKRIFTGDVIFATIRPQLLRVAVVPEELHDQVCSTAFCVLRRDTTRSIDRFIYYLVQRYQFVQKLAENATGASYPAVTDREVKEQLVPLPPLDEQCEIVTVLESLDHKISLHQRKNIVFQELFQTLLHQFMTDKISARDLVMSLSNEPTAPFRNQTTLCASPSGTQPT